MSDHHPLKWRLTKLLGRMLLRVWPALLCAAGVSLLIWVYGYGGAGAIPAIVLVALAVIVLAPAWSVFRLIKVLTAVPHASGLNRTGGIRYAAYFRFLQRVA